MQRIATEWPWPALDQSKASFVAEESAGGECVRGVEPRAVQRRSTRERGKAGRNKPAAHTDNGTRTVLGAVRMEYVQLKAAGCE